MFWNSGSKIGIFGVCVLGVFLLGIYFTHSTLPWQTVYRNIISGHIGSTDIPFTVPSLFSIELQHFRWKCWSLMRSQAPTFCYAGVVEVQSMALLVDRWAQSSRCKAFWHQASVSGHYKLNMTQYFWRACNQFLKKQRLQFSIHRPSLFVNWMGHVQLGMEVVWPKRNPKVKKLPKYCPKAAVDATQCLSWAR